MNESDPLRMTEEDLFNIKRGLAASVHLRAALALAARLQMSSEGQKFLHQWASEQRARVLDATAPKVSSGHSLILGDAAQEIVESMLHQMGL